jgi:preprotein translocase subunit SecG
MQTILIVFHLFLAIGLIGVILIQHGKGADMGAAFGSGASGTVFGAKGSASFLTRLTAGMATLFFVTSMVMAYFASQRDDGNTVLDALQQSQGEEVSLPQAPQSDLPPVPESSNLPPATSSDLPVVPAEAAEERASDLPTAEVLPESADQPTESEPAPAEQAEAEAEQQPVDSKEQ